jgi:tetratricopeptide (TPR) repeat protein
MRSSKTISIRQSDSIIDHYFHALKKSDGIFKIELLEPYTIEDTIKSFKLMYAYNFYNKKHSVKELKELVEKDSGSIMLFLIGFQEQESEKQKLYSSKNTQEYMLESIERCFGKDENLKSFFHYCTQISASKDFWELVYSRLRILYDMDDTYLSEYFKSNSYDLQSRKEFLEYLISFEYALIAIEKDDIDLAFDELTNAYEGLKSLDTIYNNNSTYHYIKGRIEFYGGNATNALKSFTKSISMNPNFGFSYYYRAIAYARLENKLEQENDFMQAEKLGVIRA